MMAMKVAMLAAAIVIGVNHLWSSWSLGVQTAVVALSHDDQSRWCKVAKNPTYFCQLVIRIFFWEVLHIITTSCLNILNIRIFCNKKHLVVNVFILFAKNPTYFCQLVIRIFFLGSPTTVWKHHFSRFLSISDLFLPLLVKTPYRRSA